jgi:DNA mismatch repair protein MutS2
MAGGVFGLGELNDPEESLAKLQIQGTALGPLEILSLQAILSEGMGLRTQFSEQEMRQRYPELYSITGEIPDLKRLLASLRGKILPSGEIDDNASPELRRIRREINERRGKIYRNLESVMRDRAPSAIQEDIVTIRNGRFVIPVRTDSRGQVPGVMHGLSSSGQTTFIEPLGVIEQNNDLVRLREQEEIEINQILLALTESLRENLAGLRATVDTVAEIDFIQARARLSMEFNCVRPQMTSTGRLLLADARHPLLEHALRRSGGQVVPVSLELGEKGRTMVISGPNAGGKTVVLKTVGLITLMAQMGLHVPASEAMLPVFDLVLADIGDHQSIAANLSTFTSHMKNIAEMASIVAPPALILLDEVGTGTDPDEGAALGVSIVEYFREAGATVIATTHYNPLKVWASETEGVLNASVEFDEKTLRPTYRLILGVAGASAGIEIARRMNVPREIISRAASLIDPARAQATEYLKKLKALVDEQESLRAALEEERLATAEKYTGLDLDFAKREAARKSEFQSELERVIREFTQESERLLSSVKDKITAARARKESEARAAELRRSAGVRLRKQIESSPLTSSAVAGEGSRPADAGAIAGPDASGPLIAASEEIHERDRVRIISLDREGMVESIDDGTFTVLVGSLRFRARREEIRLVKAALPHQSKRAQNLPKGVSAALDIDDSFSPELNIIGATVDEATDRVDKFLDVAYLSGVDEVRIVHGHGKGALRRAVSELLSGHPHVASYQKAPDNQGGAGATIVHLRN